MMTLGRLVSVASANQRGVDWLDYDDVLPQPIRVALAEAAHRHNPTSQHLFDWPRQHLLGDPKSSSSQVKLKVSSVSLINSMFVCTYSVS